MTAYNRTDFYSFNAMHIRSESRTETVKAVPVDVALGSFRVDVLTVSKVETAVIVLGVVSAVCSGSSVVSC